MSRSNGLRRIDAAIEHSNEDELRWALTECQRRKPWQPRHSHFWYRIEKRIRELLDEITSRSD